MCFIPLPEGRGIDLDDGRLGQGVRADEFIVRRMICHGDNTDFTGDAFGAPAVIAGVETEGAEFAVAAAGADEMDALGADTGPGGLATFLESSRGPMSEKRGERKVSSVLFCGSGKGVEAFRFMHTVSCDSMRAWHRWPSACDGSHERY